MPRVLKKKKAKAQVGGQQLLCSNLARPTPIVPAHLVGDPLRAAAVLETRSKWLNGTVLHYWFYKSGSHYSVPKVQADAIRGATSKH